MAVSINWATFVITVPKADMTLIQASPEIRELDLDWLRLQLKALEASVDGIVFDDTHIHNTTVTLGTTTYARVIEVISPYTIEFEDGAYLVDLVGANSNVGDPSIRVVNQVSANSNNSAGLIDATSSQVPLLRFGGSVYIDVFNGSAGTTFPIGTEESPVNNLADALAIAAANGIRRFFLRGSITLSTALDDWTLVGNGEEAEVNLNGQDVADSEFHNVKITGTMSNGPIRLFACEINSVDGFSGTATGCSLLAGTIVCAGNSSFFGCFSGVPGIGTPIVDMDSLAIGVEFRAYAGGLQVNNLANAGATLSVDFVSGQLIVDASCTAMQSGRIGGTARYVNNSNLVFNLDGLVNFDTIWRLKDVPPDGLL